MSVMMEISLAPPPSHRCTEAPPKFWRRCTKKKKKRRNLLGEDLKNGQSGKSARLDDVRVTKCLARRANNWLM